MTEAMNALLFCIASCHCLALWSYHYQIRMPYVAGYAGESHSLENLWAILQAI